MRRYSLFLMILAALLAACVGSHRSQLPLTEQKLFDLPYGSDARHRMDVFLPANRSAATPFAVLIHGGAWVKAGKEDIRQYQDSLLRNGIAVASINHRYANDSSVHYREMIADVGRAVDYCLSHARDWNTRRNGIVLTGGSSGAHLAMLYAFTSPREIKAIVELSGPTNLTDTATLNYTIRVHLVDLVQKMTGKKYTPGEPLDSAFAVSSPIRHIKNIPVLIIHGDNDPVVPYVQATQLEQRLRENHITHRLLTVPGAGHDLNLQDSLTRKIVYGAAVEWIWTYGK